MEDERLTPVPEEEEEEFEDPYKENVVRPQLGLVADTLRDLNRGISHEIINLAEIL